MFKGKTGAFAGCERVYVPIGSSTEGARLPNGDDTSISWREALIELTHEELQHQGRDKTAHALRAKYWWPGLAADVERVLADCEPCAKAKAQRTLAHGKYRAVPAGAPRKRWGMDFYGVESGYILSLIDLDSGVYEPVFLKIRAAEGVAQALLDNVICRYGVPLEVRSDDAQEFVGKCLNRLSQAIGFRISSTHGYHPEGNAKVGASTRISVNMLASHERRAIREHRRSVAADQMGMVVCDQRDDRSLAIRDRPWLSTTFDLRCDGSWSSAGHDGRA